MRYFLYVKPDSVWEIDFAARNEAAGVLGLLKNASSPLASADTRNEITELAYAHLGRHPSDILYIADGDRLIYEIVINEPYQSAQSAHEYWLAVAWTCFVLAVISLVTTASLGLGNLGVILLGVCMALYFAIVQSHLFNEIEAGVVCAILLVLGALITGAVQRAWEQSNGGLHNATNEHNDAVTRHESRR